MDAEVRLVRGDTESIMADVPVYEDATKRRVVGWLRSEDVSRGYNLLDVRLFGSETAELPEPPLGDASNTDGALILEHGRTLQPIRYFVNSAGSDFYQGAVIGGPVQWKPTGFIGGNTRDVKTIRSLDDPTDRLMPAGYYVLFISAVVSVSGVVTGFDEPTTGAESWAFAVSVEAVPRPGASISFEGLPDHNQNRVQMSLYPAIVGLASSLDYVRTTSFMTFFTNPTDTPAGSPANFYLKVGISPYERILFFEADHKPKAKTIFPYDIPDIAVALSWWALKAPLSSPTSLQEAG